MSAFGGKADIPHSSKILRRLRAYSEVVADQRKTRKPRSEDLGRGRGQPLKGGDRERGERHDIDEQHAVKWGENLVPTFQLNTATKPAKKAMYARCGRIETTASAGGAGMSFDASSMVSMANMLTRLRLAVSVVYLSGDHFG